MGATIKHALTTTEPPAKNGQQPKLWVGGGGGGGLSACYIYWDQIVALDYVVVKTQNVFITHGGPNYCNVSSQKNNIIKLTL